MKGGLHDYKLQYEDLPKRKKTKTKHTGITQYSSPNSWLYDWLVALYNKRSIFRSLKR